MQPSQIAQQPNRTGRAAGGDGTQTPINQVALGMQFCAQGGFGTRGYIFSGYPHQVDFEQAGTSGTEWGSSPEDAQRTPIPSVALRRDTAPTELAVTVWLELLAVRLRVRDRRLASLE